MYLKALLIQDKNQDLGKKELKIVKKSSGKKHKAFFDPITFTFSENSNYGQESLLEV